MYRLWPETLATGRIRVDHRCHGVRFRCTFHGAWNRLCLRWRGKRLVSSVNAVGSAVWGRVARYNELCYYLATADTLPAGNNPGLIVTEVCIVGEIISTPYLFFRSYHNYLIS